VGQVSAQSTLIGVRAVAIVWLVEGFMASTRDDTATDHPVGWEGSIATGILIMDMVSSTEFASVMGLRDYAQCVDDFHRLCREQCAHFLEVVHRGRYRGSGMDYEVRATGDELIVFIHTGRCASDVYQLVCLAITVNCGWLGMPFNVERIRNGHAPMALATGIHCGKVWARRTDSGFAKEGFAINLAKRAESLSREGERFRIFVTDATFKLLNRRIRNLLFSPRSLRELKGVVGEVGVYEVVESFVDVSKRLAPQFALTFQEAAREAMATTAFDLWVHSCLQVWEEASAGEVTDDSLELCKQVLNIDPHNAVALYFAAQGERERDNPEKAALYLEDLTRFWPQLGDGWMELGRVQAALGKTAAARRSILQAYRHGVDEAEIELPETT
jgi:class 3 adenylate cyclase